MPITAVIPGTGNNLTETAISLVGSGFGTPDNSDNPTTGQPYGYGTPGYGITSFGGHIGGRVSTSLLRHIIVTSDTAATATVPQGLAPGSYAITLIHPDGGTLTLGNAFTVYGVGVSDSAPPTQAFTRRARLIRALLSHLPHTFQTESKAIGAISLIYDGATGIAHIEGCRLVTQVSPYSPATPLNIDLRSLTLASLTAALNASYGYHAVLQDASLGQLAAAALLDGDYPLTGTIALLPTATALIPIFAGTVASALDTLRSDMDTGLAQLDMRQAAGVWLDRWGLQYGVPRYPREADDSYRTRIAYAVRSPLVNNLALQDYASKAFGVTITVTDTDPSTLYLSDGGHLSGSYFPDGVTVGPGIFTVTGLAADLTPQLKAALDAGRAAGTKIVYIGT